jgi:hypothetical protein
VQRRMLTARTDTPRGLDFPEPIDTSALLCGHLRWRCGEYTGVYLSIRPLWPRAATSELDATTYSAELRDWIKTMMDVSDRLKDIVQIEQAHQRSAMSFAETS